MTNLQLQLGQIWAGVLGSSCSNGRETHVLREHCDRVHCRNNALAPKFRSFPPNALPQMPQMPQMPQSIAVELAVVRTTPLGTLPEGRNEMFYLTTHSTHFVYGYMASDIWLRTILIVRKETRCRHIGYSFQGFFYMHHPTDKIAHTTAFVTPVVEHLPEREIAQWVP